MGFLSDLLIRIGADTSDLNVGLDSGTKSLRKFGEDATKVGTSLSVGLSLPIIGTGVAALKAAGEMEQFRVGFTTMLKSADAANAHLEQLKKFALATPFQFEELTKASRLMQAYGTSVSDVLPRLKTLGNAVSALGSGSDLLERVVRSMGEIGTRGKITGEQLRELSRAGIPALDAVAKHLGVTVAEAQQRITAGTVDAKAATDAILTYMDERFAGGMEAQSKTLLGSWSNVKDRLFFTLNDIGQALLPTAKSMISDFIEPALMRVRDLAESFGTLPKPIQSVAFSFTGLAAALPLVTVALGTVVEKAIVLESFLGKIGSFGAFGLALSGAAIGASIAFSELAERTKGLHDLDGKSIEVIDKWIQKYKDLLDTSKHSLAEITKSAQQHLGEMTVAADKFQLKLGEAFDWGIISHPEQIGKTKEVVDILNRMQFAASGGAAAMKELGFQITVASGSSGEAAKGLGIKNTEELRAELAKAIADYQTLKNSGTESAGVLEAASKKVQEAQEALTGKTLTLSKAMEEVGVRRTSEMQAAMAVIAKGFREGKVGVDVYVASLEKMGASMAKLSGGKLQPIPSPISTTANPPPFLEEAPDATRESILRLIGPIGQLQAAITPVGDEWQKVMDLIDQSTDAPRDAIIALQKAINLESADKLFGTKTIQALQQEATEAEALYEEMAKSGEYSAEAVSTAWIISMKKQVEAQLATGRITKAEYQKILDELDAMAGKSTKRRVGYEKSVADQTRESFGSAMAGAFDDLDRLLANNILHGWKTWQKNIKQIVSNLGEDMLAALLKAFFRPLEKQLEDLASKIGGTLGKVWGGGSSAASTAGGAAGSVGGAANGAGGAVSSAGGILGAVGAIGAAVGAVSSVIGNFQQAGMNKSLDLIVNHTLRIFNSTEQFRMDAWTRETHWFQKFDEFWQEARKGGFGSGSGTGTSKGGVTVNLNNVTIYGTTPDAIAAGIFKQASLAGAL